MLKQLTCRTKNLFYKSQSNETNSYGSLYPTPCSCHQELRYYSHLALQSRGSRICSEGWDGSVGKALAQMWEPVLESPDHTVKQVCNIITMLLLQDGRKNRRIPASTAKITYAVAKQRNCRKKVRQLSKVVLSLFSSIYTNTMEPVRKKNGCVHV